MVDFISYPFYWDTSPLDISFVFAGEKPAGRHGFLQVQGNEFIFSDGRPARFWGTCLNSGANFPEADYAEKTARRLASFGVNLVRLHQLDAEWATPNIFLFSKGQRLKTTRQLDPDSMQRLDYLIYCLKKEGIYCYLDLMTYRKFKSGDGVANALALGDNAKPYSNYARRLIDLQKEFANNLFNHINPYTGLAYKDDPVFVLCELNAECDMFSERFDFSLEPYRSELIALMQDWLAQNGKSYPVESASFLEKDPLMLEFKLAVQRSYYQEMAKFLREIGVKIPLTGTNWTINAANALAQRELDYTDSHNYFYQWNWGEFTKGADPRALVAERDGFLTPYVFNSAPDLPFFASEWDVPWPNQYRADSALQMAAGACLQGWGGASVHTYMYATRRDQKVLGKEITARTISNVPYREGIFATWNDPAKFGLFYHAALIMRRGDVDRAKKSLAVALDDLDGKPGDIKDLGLLAQQHKVGLSFTGQSHGADQLISADQGASLARPGEVVSDTGQIWRSWEKRIGWIDTPRTQCLYGFFAQDDLATSDLNASVANQYAVIALSSLSEEAIKSSDNLLLTTVGKVENSGMRFNADGTEVLDTGKEPVKLEIISARISIRTDRPDLTVWAVGPEGFLTGRIPSSYQAGQLCFTLGKTCASLYYLIQAE